MVARRFAVIALWVSAAMSQMIDEEKAKAKSQLGENDYALIAAAAEGDVKMTKRLLAAGSNAKAATEDGETSLHTCGISGSAEVARLLLDAGAVVDARVTAPKGLHMTPLTWFTYGLHLEGIKVLMEFGANINLVVDDEEGNHLTALDIASRMTEGHEMVAHFRTNGGKRFEELTPEEITAYSVAPSSEATTAPTSADEL